MATVDTESSAQDGSDDARPRGAQTAIPRCDSGTRGYVVVPSNPRVAVTRTGKVKVLVGYGHGAEWRRIHPRRNRSGHMRIRVPDKENSRSYFVHRLVMEAFVGPCPAGMLCRHLNGIPDDNRIENLAWGSPQENADDKREHALIRERRTTPLLRNAPDLLTCTKELVEVCERNFHRWSRGNTPNQRRIAQAIILAKEIIARVEGRED